MRLALECNTKLLEMAQPFADYDFILAKEVLRDEEYKGFYAKSDKVKVVDNGVNEEGEPLGLDELEEAFNMVGGHYVVSPDWFGDFKKTVAAYPECIKRFGEEKVIGVLQGINPKEALGCLNIYGRTVAVPYAIGSIKKEAPPWLMGLRRALVVSNIPEDRLVHLLGFTILEELWWYENKPNVAFLDTGIPILMGLQGLDILDPVDNKAESTYGKMGDLELDQVKWTAVCRNIALLRRYMP